MNLYNISVALVSSNDLIPRKSQVLLSVDVFKGFSLLHAVLSCSQNSAFLQHYTLGDQCLGSGSFSTCRVCTDKKTGTEYAVKIISKRSPFVNYLLEQTFKAPLTNLYLVANCHVINVSFNVCCISVIDVYIQYCYVMWYLNKLC